MPRVMQGWWLTFRNNFLTRSVPWKNVRSRAPRAGVSLRLSRDNDTKKNNIILLIGSCSLRKNDAKNRYKISKKTAQNVRSKQRDAKTREKSFVDGGFLSLSGALRKKKNNDTKKNNIVPLIGGCSHEELDRPQPKNKPKNGTPLPRVEPPTLRDRVGLVVDWQASPTLVMSWLSGRCCSLFIYVRHLFFLWSLFRRFVLAGCLDFLLARFCFGARVDIVASCCCQ